MASASHPKAVKLTMGLIFKDEIYFAKAKMALLRNFGKIDFESDEIPFKYTDYYQEEFGSSLKRRFLSFERPIFPDRLARIKVITNKIEQRLSREGRRLVNIDPGYLDLSRLVLATTKDFSHRIYLRQGIYAEVTLIFNDKSFRPLEWTYPDYRTPEYIGIFNRLRELYRNNNPVPCRGRNGSLKI